MLRVDAQSPDEPTASCVVRQPDDDCLPYDLVAGATETEQVHKVSPRNIGQKTEGVEMERRPRSNCTVPIGPVGPIDDAFPSTTCRGVLGARVRRPLSHEASMRRAHHSVEAEPLPASEAARPLLDAQRRSPTPLCAGPFARLEAAAAKGNNAVGARSSSHGLSRSSDGASKKARPTNTTTNTTKAQVRPQRWPCGQCLILTSRPLLPRQE